MRKLPGERKRNYQEVEHEPGSRAPSTSREKPETKTWLAESCRFGFVQHGPKPAAWIEVADLRGPIGGPPSGWLNPSIKVIDTGS
jgi:hypothetical protein